MIHIKFIPGYIHNQGKHLESGGGDVKSTGGGLQKHHKLFHILFISGLTQKGKR